MTLNEIRLAIATYLDRDADELNVNDIDVGLIALNQVRMNAELTNDFEFTRKLLSLSVDGVTGGNLANAVEYGTIEPVVEIKTVVDVGTFDSDGNFRASGWTTTADALNQQRADNPNYMWRYPPDAGSFVSTSGFIFSGDSVYFNPKTPNTVFNVGVEAYTFTPEWTEEDLDDGNPDRYDGPWNLKGSQYLMWQGIVQVNHIHKHFVFRQEGNLPPPDKMALEALENLIRWDNFKYQQFRRHSR